MQTQEILTLLCEKYGLGKLQGTPDAVTGGLLHQMYHVLTDHDEFAIKLLNPDIMRRPNARRNMVNSERIAHMLADTVPVAAALEFQGRQLLSLKPTAPVLRDGLTAEVSPVDTVISYAMVYPWLEGRSLFAPEISAAHCRKVGRLLGRIHHANIRLEGVEKEETHRPLFNWQGYLSLAGQQKAKWLADYEAMLPNLTRWDQAAVDAMGFVHSFQVISHRDLDPKNVMWKDSEPYLIDWEAAGYINPYQELLEVLNYWGRDEQNNYDPALCQALLREYAQFAEPPLSGLPLMNLRLVDWAPVFACSYDSMLGWLEYALKKSLGLEGNGKSRTQGIHQLLAAYADLQRYEAQTSVLQNIIMTIP